MIDIDRFQIIDIDGSWYEFHIDKIEIALNKQQLCQRRSSCNFWDRNID